MNAKTALLAAGTAIGVFIAAAGVSWAIGGVGTPGGAVLKEVPFAGSPSGTAVRLDLPAKDLGKPAVTFYVVAYHWGWGILREDGTEVDQIRVKEGTTVEIFAVENQANEAIKKLPEPVAKAIQATDWEARTMKAVEDGRIPEPVGMTIEEAMTAAEAGEKGVPLEKLVWPYMGDHGFLIHAQGVSEFLAGAAKEPVRVVFKATGLGEHQFVCTNYCGYGHRYQPTVKLIVE